jgi:hypothetical protein
MDNFPPPPFAARDVTRDELFTGGHLAYTTIDELRAELEHRSESSG